MAVLAPFPSLLLDRAFIGSKTARQNAHHPNHSKNSFAERLIVNAAGTGVVACRCRACNAIDRLAAIRKHSPTELRNGPVRRAPGRIYHVGSRLWMVSP